MEGAAVALPVTYVKECVVNHVSSSWLNLDSSNSSGIDLESNKCGGFRPIPNELLELGGKNKEIVVLKDTLATVENAESLLVTCVEPQENMNYIRSRFFRQDALQRSNPLNSAENVLRLNTSHSFGKSQFDNFFCNRRDYRHRRRHRKDLSKLINITNDDNSENEDIVEVEDGANPAQLVSLGEVERVDKTSSDKMFAKCRVKEVNDTCKEASPALKVEVTVTIDQVCTHVNQSNESISRQIEGGKESDPVHSTSNPEEIKKVPLEEEEEDPLSFIQIKSAAQWMAVSKRISWNFEETEETTDAAIKDEEPSEVVAEVVTATPPPTNSPVLPLQPPTPTISRTKAEDPDLPPLVHDYDNVLYDIYCPKYDGTVTDFKPTKEQQLRLICWKIKPWKQPKVGHGQPRLFTSAFGAGWGVDCDEVIPGLFIGDKASASNVAFLKRYGITHVLNAAEGTEEGLVDLSSDHYEGSGITYLGFPLWDAPGNATNSYYIQMISPVLI